MNESKRCSVRVRECVARALGKYRGFPSLLLVFIALGGRGGSGGPATITIGRGQTLLGQVRFNAKYISPQLHSTSHIIKRHCLFAYGEATQINGGLRGGPARLRVSLAWLPAQLGFVMT